MIYFYLILFLFLSQFVFLMADAILVLSKDNIVVFFFPTFQRTVKDQHWILQMLGAVLIIIGLVSITTLIHEDHFDSYHGIIGLTAVVFSFLTCFGGIFAYLAMKMKNVIKPAHNKLAHTIIGILSFALGIVAEGTGFYTISYELTTSKSVQLASTILMSSASFVVIEGAFVSAWSRWKRLWRRVIILTIYFVSENNCHFEIALTIDAGEIDKKTSRKKFCDNIFLSVDWKQVIAG